MTDAPLETPPNSRKFFGLAIILLLLYGVGLWLVVMKGIAFRHHQTTLVAIAALLAMVRPVARAIACALDALVEPSPRARLITTIAIFIAAGFYLYFQASHQQRSFAPRYHDEY